MGRDRSETCGFPVVWVLCAALAHWVFISYLIANNILYYPAVIVNGVYCAVGEPEV